MTQDISSLLERLRGRGNRYDDGTIMHHELRNPDGPEAADTIERLQAELATVRERTIEEAARVVDAKGADPSWHPMFRRGCSAAVTAIRSLGDTPE